MPTSKIPPKPQDPKPPITPKLCYNRKEVAELLGLHVVTITRLTQRGLLHPSRATRKPIYTHEELQRFLKETSTPIEK